MLVLFIYLREVRFILFLDIICYISYSFVCLNVWIYHIFNVSVWGREIKSMYNGEMRWLEANRTVLLTSGKASVRYIDHSRNSVFCILEEKLINIFK